MRPRDVVRVVSIGVLLSGAALTAARQEGPAPPAGQAGTLMPVRVGGAIKQPTRIKTVEAVYPEEAKRAGISGVVIIELTLGPNGKTINARILHGVPLLDIPALDAVRQWEYTPTLLNGTPVPVIMTVTVNFTLAVLPGGGGDGLLSDADARKEPFLLAPGRAGTLQLGMAVDALYLRVPQAQTRLVDLKEDGHFTPAIEIRLDQDAARPALVAQYRQIASRWVVWGIAVNDPRFRTSDGLGVGSTLADIQAIASDARPSMGEHGPVVALEGRGISFLLDPGGRDQSPEGTPKGGIVRQVWLYRPVPAAGPRP